MQLFIFNYLAFREKQVQIMASVYVTAREFCNI